MARRKNYNRSRQNYQFWSTAWDNSATFNVWYNRLIELAIACFEWKNLPDTVDPRFLELALLSDGVAVYFNDDVLGNLCLRTMLTGQRNVYDIPMRRKAYASNGYNMELNEDNSVLIYNNYIHLPSTLDLAMYANKLAQYDNIIDVNVNAQKTPVLITASEQEKLSMQNLYIKYEGNIPYIFGSKELRPDALKVLKTDAPYVADKIYDLKTNVWNEALTYLGIANVSITKRERMITDEVNRMQGGTIASRHSRLEARRDAVEKINAMFGTEIEVTFREDLDTTMPDEPYISTRKFRYEEGGEEDV